jgi:adenosine/AMP kinase
MLDISRKIYFHYRNMHTPASMPHVPFLGLPGEASAITNINIYGGDMDITAVRMELPEGTNLILGQTHFIKTIEDLYEIIATTAPQARFGVAFTEASGPCLIRHEGNDPELVNTCITNLESMGAGHVFCIILRDAFPINILNAVKNCPEVCRIFCATANPLEVVVGATEQGAGVLGVIDGFSPKGVETDRDKSERKEFLRKIGYKL